MEDCVDHGQKGMRTGYGCAAYHGKVTTYHRKVYMEHHGLSHMDLVGKVVMHTCDNPRCINVTHLRLGTHKDNTKDMHDKGRGGKPKAEARHDLRKLTTEQARAIRQSAESSTALMARYNVARCVIWKIRNNKTYREVV